MNEILKAIDASFNQHFCHGLEFHLTESETFDDFSNKFERFWCDGISMPEYDSELFLNNVVTSKQICTQAWMALGENGLGIYQMTIKLGPQSIENCINGEPLTDCLPDTDDLDWITMDTDEKTIEVRLK